MIDYNEMDAWRRNEDGEYESPIPDRVSENEDGTLFYGFDDENSTTWYDEDKNLDSMTSLFGGEEVDKDMAKYYEDL